MFVQLIHNCFQAILSVLCNSVCESDIAQSPPQKKSKIRVQKYSCIRPIVCKRGGSNTNGGDENACELKTRVINYQIH